MAQITLHDKELPSKPLTVPRAHHSDTHRKGKSGARTYEKLGRDVLSL